MSYEQPLNNEENKEVLSDKHPEDFDAKGNPRSVQILPNGETAFMSHDEYIEAAQAQRDAVGE